MGTAASQVIIEPIGTPGIFCQNCGGVIDPERAHRRGGKTRACSDGCKKELDAKYEAARKEKRCTHCLRPCTDQEREEWRQWRAERAARLGTQRGILDVKRAEPSARDRHFAQKSVLTSWVRKVLPILQEAADFLMQSSRQQNEDHSPTGSSVQRKFFSEWTELIDERIAEAKVLIDRKG